MRQNSDGAIHIDNPGITSYERLHEQRLREQGRPGFDYEGLGYNELYPTLCTTPRHLHGTDWVVDRGLEFLAHRQKNQPFSLWISVHDPHPPLIAYEPYFSMYDLADIPDPVIPDWLDTEECPSGSLLFLPFAIIVAGVRHRW